MTRREQLERWGPLVLGVVCVFLVFRLISQVRGNEARAGRLVGKTNAAPPREVKKAGPALPKAAPDASPFDSNLRADLLEKIEKRPLPDMARNPFEFVVPKAPASRKIAGNTPPPPPPPPPPLPLKALGYSDEGNGASAAYISYENQVFAVHEGDTVGGRYKIVKISTTMVQVEDANTGQKGELPIPQ